MDLKKYETNLIQEDMELSAIASSISDLMIQMQTKITVFQRQII